jgi:hypothetical protein
VDKEEYYENEAITGYVRLLLSKELRDFTLKLKLVYEEHYVLYNEEGDTAL